jgi:sterol desaturase/sphingolipid hydroxylase (fatty acid hydroxylase superfamily)
METSMILFKNIFLMFTFQTGRYFLFAGLAYLIIWKWSKSYALKHQTQTVGFKPGQITQEIKWSMLTNLIFTGITLLSYWTSIKDGTLTSKMTFEFNFMTVVWILGLILFHDAYFYWMHRAIHHPKVYKLIHRTHHLSTNPSPWAAYSFHPIEAVLEVVWTIPIIYFLKPNLFIMLLFSIIILFVNVTGHSGVEIYPASWSNHRFLKYILRPDQHNDHHHYFKGNYGLYFSFWDRWMGTFRK